MWLRWCRYGCLRLSLTDAEAVASKGGADVAERLGEHEEADDADAHDGKASEQGVREVLDLAERYCITGTIGHVIDDERDEPRGHCRGGHETARGQELHWCIAIERTANRLEDALADVQNVGAESHAVFIGIRAPAAP